MRGERGRQGFLGGGGFLEACPHKKKKKKKKKKQSREGRVSTNLTTTPTPFKKTITTSARGNKKLSHHSAVKN